MSETPAEPQKPAASPVPAASSGSVQDALNQLSELKVYTHSPILYWWPIWVLGFVFGFVSLFVGGEGTFVVLFAEQLVGIFEVQSLEGVQL